jgi:hypothetical protein
VFQARATVGKRWFGPQYGVECCGEFAALLCGILAAMWKEWVLGLTSKGCTAVSGRQCLQLRKQASVPCVCVVFGRCERHPHTGKGCKVGYCTQSEPCLRVGVYAE